MPWIGVKKPPELLDGKLGVIVSHVAVSDPELSQRGVDVLRVHADYVLEPLARVRVALVLELLVGLGKLPFGVEWLCLVSRGTGHKHEQRYSYYQVFSHSYLYTQGRPRVKAD